MRLRLATWPPILRALLGLLAGFGISLLLARNSGIRLPPWGWALSVGALAALSGRALRLEGWWMAILAAFPAAVMGLASLTLAPGWYLGLFLLLWLVYWSSFSTRVPLYLSGPKVRAALLARLPAGPALRFVDLGCGLGGLALALARARPDARFRGVELAPIPAAIGLLRARFAALPNLQLSRASLWDEPLGEQDVVYCFLSPVPMPKLWEKARREMKAGSLLVSNSFTVPGHEPDEIIEVGDARGSRLLCWRMPGPATA
jgi:precorrin-6B methylase 2